MIIDERKLEPGKVLDWLMFQLEVHKHINNYVIPQYGEKGSDPANDYSIEECMMHINRYRIRQGKNSRPDQDKLDLIKIAHYAQMAYTKLMEKENAKS